MYSSVFRGDLFMHFFVTGSNNEETTRNIGFSGYREIVGISHVKIRIPRIVWLVLTIVDGQFHGFSSIFSFVHYCVFGNVQNRLSWLFATHMQSRLGASHPSFALSTGAPT